MAGGRKTGGRKKGSVNKRTLALRVQAVALLEGVDASRMTPLDVMLHVMRDNRLDATLRFEAARAAAPYLHPRLAAIEHTGASAGPIQVEKRHSSDIEVARMIARVLLKVPGGSLDVS
jgi:hypothetical protein